MVRNGFNAYTHLFVTEFADEDFNHLIVVWGQYIDHDFALSPQSVATSTFQGLTNCAQTCNNEPPCFPIQVKNDNFAVFNEG